MTDKAPADLGFRMPAEWEPHARCWMAWPCREELWGERLDEARAAYADVARAIADFEPVTMVARPEQVAGASLRCGSGVSVLPLDLDDSWMRDTGPSFLVDEAGAVAGVDWRFNGWGGKYRPFDKDAAAAGAILDHLGLPAFRAPIVLEGGAIHVDGAGTAMTTEQCLLDPSRNPGLDRAEIEDCLRRHLGVRKTIWLGRGLEGDETDGHVDNLACFVRPGTVLALAAGDSDDPDFEVLADNLARLRAARDANGRELEVIEVPRPRLAHRAADGARLVRSYVNFYVANGGVLVPAFGDDNDRQALEIIAAAFPGRRTVPLTAAATIVEGGGGIHCVTLQQPAAAAAA